MKQMNHLPEVESLRSCTERHYNCAQSLLVPFRDVTGLSRAESDRLGNLFGSGMHHGGVAQRTQAWLNAIGKKADYISTIIMHDNAIIVFDMDEQRRLEPEKQVDAHIADIKADIEAGKKQVQEAEQGEIDFYEHFVEWIRQTGPMYSFPLYSVTEACVGCGTCSRVCPRGCIHLEDGTPAYDYTRCANCMACIQACPTKAIQFATVKEPNPKARYRNPHISLREIVDANNQA